MVVKRVALDKLSTYGSLVNDLGVSQSPSVVVIDRDLKGTVLTGYVDTVAINQVIADARHEQHPPERHGRLPARRQRAAARDSTRASTRWSHPTVAGQQPR